MQGHLAFLGRAAPTPFALAQLTPAPPAAAATIWRQCVGPCRCCEAISSSQTCRAWSKPIRGTRTACRSGCRFKVRVATCMNPMRTEASICPRLGMGTLTANNTAAQQKAYAECRRIAPLMLEGDYYPLTPYSRELNRWIAWQFNRPEQGDGVIQAFRRPQCAEEAARYILRGLDPQLRYAVTDLDTAQSADADWPRTDGRRPTRGSQGAARRRRTDLHPAQIEILPT